MKAIILAGGLGTRLRSVIGDEAPKCMAPINGKPVIGYIIDDMNAQGITDITLSLYYCAEAVMEYFGKRVKYRIEDIPLGTGGAIRNCISGKNPVLVVNGDTIAKIDYNDMLSTHSRQLTIAIDKHGTNAGIYIMNTSIFHRINTPKSFSFEKETIQRLTFSHYNIESFIDIGTPEGYAAAQSSIS